MPGNGPTAPSERVGLRAWERAQRRAVTVLETPGAPDIPFFQVSRMHIVLSLEIHHYLGVHWATWGRESGGLIGMQQSRGWVKSQQSAAAQFRRPRMWFVGGRCGTIWTGNVEKGRVKAK
jgi:hypothetical protein